MLHKLSTFFKSVSSAMLDINGKKIEGIPDYPCVIDIPPNGFKAPMPHLYTKDWTDAPKHIFQPSFDEHITLPDPQENPAFYGAAIVALRITTAYFLMHGPYGKPQKYPTKTTVDNIYKMWRKTFKDKITFPSPPDLRILLVRKNGVLPTDMDTKGRRLWTAACKLVQKMDSDAKWKLLTSTHKEHYDESIKAQGHIDDCEDFIINMYARYIVHFQHTTIKATSLDMQPSPIELDEFFAHPENKNGATIFDLHRYFINVKDIPEFVRRIERYATLTRRPASLGIELREAVYIRKSIPSLKDVEAVLERAAHSLPELLGAFPDGVGSDLAVLEMVKGIATPDYSTGRWVLKSFRGPHAVDIWTAMGDDGQSLDTVVRKFPDQVGSLKEFAATLLKVAYKDEVTHLWYRKMLEVDGTVLDEETSRKIRVLRSLAASNPMQMLAWVEAGAVWDAAAGEFVGRRGGKESPKRKREAEDVGGEETEEERDSPPRAIKKPRSRASSV